jgi:hypothetical protein
MHVRLPFAFLALGAAFGAGLLSSRLVEHEARAQSRQQTAAVFVPAEGLAFRALDGRVIARLSYDGHGGDFEVYDQHERPSVALRPGFAAETSRPAAAAPVFTVSGPTDTPDLGY